MENEKILNGKIALGYEDFPVDITAGVVRKRVLFVAYRVFFTMIIGYLILFGITVKFASQIENDYNALFIKPHLELLGLAAIFSMIGYFILKGIGMECLNNIKYFDHDSIRVIVA